MTVQHFISFTAISALTLLDGCLEEHMVCKKLKVLISLERGANDLYMVQLMPLPPPSSLASLKSNCFNLSGASLPGCPAKRPLNRLVGWLLGV